MTNDNERRTYARFEEIDWSNWHPEQRATELFVISNRQILLIHKKRGLGAGKIIGPGGRLDDGESVIQGAIREVQEELIITPKKVRQCGELFFQFVEGLSIGVYVFVAQAFEGEPKETEEASPVWVSIDDIPYDEMWADDRIWLPLMLEGKQFEGRFLFDGDTMLGHQVLSEPS